MEINCDFLGGRPARTLRNEQQRAEVLEFLSRWIRDVRASLCIACRDKTGPPAD